VQGKQLLTLLSEVAELGELLNQLVKLQEDLLVAIHQFQEVVLLLTHLQAEVEEQILT
jgi:hypothetical protein